MCTITLTIFSLTINQTQAKPWTFVGDGIEAAQPAASASLSTTITSEIMNSNNNNNNESHNQNLNEFSQKAITPTYQFDMQVEPYMQLQKLDPTSNNITCNDGSQVGYYKRLNKHSKSWIIYLQGGGFCGNEESCQQRWQRSSHLMSSNYWPKTKTGKCGFKRTFR